MSARRYTEIPALMFLAGCAVALGAALPVCARTEAEAADELIAVLGVTLPCPRFAAAWLEPPTTIEYRCTPSIERAIRLRESLPRERVGYIIDMQIARDRYASAYSFRGAPTPAVALAQFVAGVSSNAGRHAAPLIVYRKTTTSPTPAASQVAGPPAFDARNTSVPP